MTTKVDSTSAEESQHSQSPILKPTSANSASGPKVSMFGVKSGFVIPKNKLSGSLVPIIRGGGKVEPGDVGKEDSAKQVQRKTRWGADLTQDAAVRKERTLAYQTRLEQITEQLKSGSLELGGNQDSHSPGKASNMNFVEQLTADKLHRHELLELEKREVIGEILRLTPGYKAPPDYKPLLKEAKVSIPLKTHPGNNFIGLILGPASNTQKRLEEETGAKVRVYGTKTQTKEKCEITRSDATEAQAVYEELFVHISADTYEKVDAAVALIELLVTPVSAAPVVASTTPSSVSGDSVVDQSQKDSTSAHVTMPVGMVNQGTVQPMILPPHSVLPQFQAYAGPWRPHGLSNVVTPPSAGFIPSPVSNNMQYPPPVNLLNAPLSGGHPTLGTVPRSSSVGARPEPPMQNFQQPLNQATTPPPSHATAIQQLPPAYPATPSPAMPMLPAVSPAIPVRSMQAARPTHLGPQPAPAPGGFLYNRPLSMPSGSSFGFPAAPLPSRPNNMTHIVPPPSIPLQRPHPLVSQNNVALPSQPGTPAPAGPPAANFTPRASFSHQSSILPSNLSNAPHVGHVPSPAIGSSPLGSLPAPAPVPTFLPARIPIPSPRPLSGPVSASSTPITSTSPQVSAQGAVPPQSAPLSIVRSPALVPLLPSGQASIPASLPGPSHQPVPAVAGPALGSSPSFPPKLSMAGPASGPPITSPKPQLPSPGDFTFQPHRSQVSTSVTSPMPSPQPVSHTVPQVPLGAAQAPLNQNASQLPLAPPTAPSFRPAPQNLPIPVGMPGLRRPQGVGHMGPLQGPLQPPSSASSGPFPGNPTSVLAPPRVPAFQNANTPPGAQVGPRLRDFVPAIPNLSGSIASRPATLVQAHNQLPPGHQSHGHMALNQRIASSLPSYVPGKPASTPGGSQIYDPFSPTSISSGPRQQEDDPAKARKPETDAEYEDLMASVGVR